MCLLGFASSMFASTNAMNATSDSDSDSGDLRKKIRLEYNSSNTYTREILVIADETATDGYDSEFDSEMDNIQADDMYWLIGTGKYLNQGVNDINDDTILPIGVNTSTNGISSIAIDKLENIPASMNIYLYDVDLGIYHSLKDGAYEVYLNSGAHLNRFEIVFTQPETLSTSEFQTADALDIMFDMSTDQIKILNTNNIKINTVEVYSILGQSIHRSNRSNTTEEVKINTDSIRTGTYVVIVKAENGISSKKILVN